MILIASSSSCPWGARPMGKYLQATSFLHRPKTATSSLFAPMQAMGRYLEQNYTLSPDNYRLDYRIAANGLENVMTQKELRFYWENHLDKLERNQTYERTMSSVYYKTAEETWITVIAVKTTSKASGKNLCFGFRTPTSFSIPAS
jgi:hypothetical protein